MHKTAVLSVNPKLNKNTVFSEELPNYIVIAYEDKTVVFVTEEQYISILDNLDIKKIYDNISNVIIHKANNLCHMTELAFKSLYTENTSKVGIWNMAYDVPLLIRGVIAEKGDLNKVFSDPRVPINKSEQTDCFVFRLHESTSTKLNHVPIPPCLREHSFTVTGSSTKFHGLMQLYKQKELVKQNTYTLDYCLNINGLAPLQQFKDLNIFPEKIGVDWFIAMQESYPHHHLLCDVLYTRAEYDLTKKLLLF